jgi:hypothetical protein
LEDAGRDNESHAVVFLSGFWLALRTRKRAKVGLYLRLAETCVERFMETRSSPGHLAELRLAQGTELFRSRRYEEARERFTEALRHLPKRCGRFRYQVHLRLAAVSRRLGLGRLPSFTTWYHRPIGDRSNRWRSPGGSKAPDWVAQRAQRPKRHSF